MQSKRIISLFLLPAMLAALLIVPAFAAVVVDDITKKGTANTAIAFSLDDFTNAIDDAGTDTEDGIDSVTFTDLPSKATVGSLVVVTSTPATIEDGGTETTDVATGVPVPAADIPNLEFRPVSGLAVSVTIKFSVKIGTEDSNTANLILDYTPVVIPPVVPTKYSDLWHGTAQTHWSYTSAGMLAEKGLIVGEKLHGHYYFYPERPITRGEYVMWVNSVMEIALSTKAASDFADVTLPHLIEQFNAAKEKGYINGVSEGTKLYLYPDRTLNRAEAIMIISNALGAPENTTEVLDYVDKATIPSWAMGAVRKLTGLKIVQGNSKKELQPLAPVKRSEAAEMLYKLYKERIKQQAAA